MGSGVGCVTCAVGVCICYVSYHGSLILLCVLYVHLMCSIVLTDPVHVHNISPPLGEKQFYSILFYSILFYSILLCSILFTHGIKVECEVLEKSLKGGKAEAVCSIRALPWS